MAWALYLLATLLRCVNYKGPVIIEPMIHPLLSYLFKSLIITVVVIYSVYTWVCSIICVDSCHPLTLMLIRQVLHSYYSLQVFKVCCMIKKETCSQLAIIIA